MEKEITFRVKIECETCKNRTVLLISPNQLKTWKNYWQCICGAIPYRFDPERKIWYAKKFRETYYNYRHEGAEDKSE